MPEGKGGMMFNTFPSHGRPFGDSYWPAGEREVGTIEIDKDTFKLIEKTYESGGCFGDHMCLLAIQSWPPEFPGQRAEIHILSSYESWLEILKVRGISLEEEVRKALKGAY